MELGKSDLNAMLALGYDAWAPRYDADMHDYGYRLPSRMAAEVRRHIPNGDALMLDVGAGSGLLGQALRDGGYDNLEGLDPSPGMLRQARAKGVYRRRQMALGATTPLAPYRYEAILAGGVFKPGHAPPHALEELLRLARPGGIIVVNLETGPGGEAYTCFGRHLVAQQKWRHLRATAPFAHLPRVAPEAMTVIHTFQTSHARRHDRQPSKNT